METGQEMRVISASSNIEENPGRAGSRADLYYRLPVGRHHVIAFRSGKGDIEMGGSVTLPVRWEAHQAVQRRQWR